MRLRLHADGGSRGNPGIAGAGSTVMDPDTVVAGAPQELASQWEFITHATNNVAEYRGLLNGLRLAAQVAQKAGEDPQQTTVDVFLDSKLIVEQMNGRWKIKHPDLLPLAREAKQQEAGFASVTYTWVPRARNKRADELANRAMDQRASGQAFTLSSEPSLYAQENPPLSPTGAATAPAEVEHADAPTSTLSTSISTSTAPEVTAPTAAPTALHSPEWHGGQSPTRFLLLRHGETAMSAAKQYSGLSDPALTHHGLWQARRAAKYLATSGTLALPGGITTILSSPLSRTRSTARAAAEALGISQQHILVEPGLVEMDFGQWEGKTFTEVRAAYPDQHRRFILDAATTTPGGECQEDVFQRVSSMIRRLLARYQGNTVLLVSHVTPIKAILRYALGANAAMFRTLHLDVAGLSVVEFFPNGSSVVRRVNDTHYLE